MESRDWKNFQTTSLKSFIYLPILAFVLIPGGIIICYAVIYQHEFIRGLPGFPFISDLGVQPPSNAIFSLLFNWGALATFATMYSYYKYVIHTSRQSKLNIAALVFGFITCFGITLVASFEWIDSFVPHMIGAGLTFAGCIVYFWMIVSISWSLVPDVHSRSIVYLRIVIASLTTLLLIAGGVGIMLVQVNKAKFFNMTSILEWCLTYLSYLFLLTFIYDLRNIRTTEVNLKLQRSTNNHPVTSSATCTNDAFVDVV
ncbi:unnamed protein product [Clavelina lepadiformis]|uniref:CWH43-like N-terminal domain-containing protein n=1 Tax=Clavelina lepadiformis TaxID=159417 RepID=A0ABP0F2T3_CLALP